MSKEIGKKIKSIRESKQISQSQLAKKAGIAQSTLSYIENGKKNPQFHTLSSICKALDTSVLELFAYGEEELSIKIFEENKKLSIHLVVKNKDLSLSEKNLPTDIRNELYNLEKYLFDKYKKM